MRLAIGFTAALLAALLVALPHAGPLLAAWFPSTRPAIYPFAGFASLLLRQAVLVAEAVATSSLAAVLIAVAVTRGGGTAFRPLAGSIAAFGQTFPPVAVLALAVPLLGYGERPALLALFLYGLLPVLANALAGLDSVPPSVREAADGMGYTGLARVAAVELPLAAPLIVAGIRTAAIIDIGTASIASTVGVPTLGNPILDGLTGDKTGYVVEGAVLVALLAVLVDLAFEAIAGWLPASRARRS